MDGDYAPGIHDAYSRHSVDGLFAFLLAFVCVTLASGCGSMQSWYHNGFKIGPQYRRPAVHVEDQWIDADDPDVQTETRLDTNWWSVFSDPILNQLISMAYQENLPLRVAALRVMEARAQRAIASGNLFAQHQQAFGSYTRSQRSHNSQPRFGALMPRAWDQWATGFDASWEFDIWGRYRRAIQAADAELNANIEDYDAILVTLIGDVASTYVEIRSLDERLALARENVTVQEGSLAVAESRFRNGRVSELDVDQARTNVEATRALIPELEKQRRKAQNRLAVLLGGRSAEEIVFNETSTGAQNDLQKATELARQMVVQFGMSEELGPLCYPGRDGPVGVPELALRSPWSEKTARQIDAAVRSLVDSAHQRALSLLTQHRETLLALAEALKKKEVLDEDELRRVLSEHGVELNATASEASEPAAAPDRQPAPAPAEDQQAGSPAEPRESRPL